MIIRSEEHTSELQSLAYLVCRLLLEKKKKKKSLLLSLTTFVSVSLTSCLFVIGYFVIFFFFNDTATTEIYTLSLHDALPISPKPQNPPMLNLIHFMLFVLLN